MTTRSMTDVCSGTFSCELNLRFKDVRIKQL